MRIGKDYHPKPAEHRQPGQKVCRYIAEVVIALNNHRYYPMAIGREFAEAAGGQPTLPLVITVLRDTGLKY